MRRGGTLSAAFLTCLLLGGAAAQRTGDLDFLSGLEDYRLARGMLPHGSKSAGGRSHG
jgi:hypothetical protein